MVLEKTLESPLDSKEIKPVNPKGNQPWIFTGRTDAEAEAPILWPPDVKNWLIWKDPDAGRDWGQEEKGTTEDEMAGWHHWLHGHESEWTLGLVMDREAWCAGIHGVSKSQIWLNNWTEWTNIIPNLYFSFQIRSDLPFTFHFQALEKQMATHSWRIPGMGEPGGLLSMGSHRVGQD